MEAVAPDSPVLAPDPRERVRRGLAGDRGVEGGVEDRDVRHVRGKARGAASMPASAGALWSGAIDSSSRDARADRVVDQRGLDEPRAAVDDAMADGIDLGGANVRRATRRLGHARPSKTRWSFRLVEPALTTRIAPTHSERPGPVADLRIVVAVLARVRACLKPPVDHLLPKMSPRSPPGRARGR